MGNKQLSATVKMIISDSRAIVELPNGQVATIQQEVFAPGVPLDWLLTEGMSLLGEFEPLEGSFVPSAPARTLDAVSQHFGLDRVTLGLVQEVTRKSARVAVLPGVVVEMAKEEITGNPFDVISSYLDVGDVISIRLYRHPEGKVRLRMTDIDDDEEVLPALPLIHGGQPWLIEGRNVPWYSEVQSAELPSVELSEERQESGVASVTGEASKTASPAPGPGLHSALPDQQKPSGKSRELDVAKFAAKHAATEQRRLLHENGRLRAERAESDQLVSRLQSRQVELSEEISRLRVQLSEARKLKRSQEVSKSTTFSRRNRWESDLDWFNEELRRAWIGRYKPSERSGVYKLNFDKFAYSKEFFASITSEKVGEDEIRKLVRVMLDLLTGRNASEHKHVVHELFEYQGGPQRVREDGSLCWRVHLENGSPQAKRLHYWAHRDSVIEFGWVANHDDDL